MEITNKQETTKSDVENVLKTDISDTGSVIFSEEESKITETPVQSDSILPNNIEFTNSKPSFHSFSADLLSESSLNEFKKEFPTVDIEKISKQEDFQALLSILMNNPTLSNVYSCFNSITTRAEERQREKIEQAVANAAVSVGSLRSVSEQKSPFFTREQVLRMSREEIKENLDLIRQSQSKW